MQLRTFRFLEWVNLTNWMESVLKKWYIFQGRHWRQRLRDWGLAWILSRVWNFRKYNVASTLFFQGLDHIFSAYNFQFKRKEARLPLLILNNKKKILTLLFAPYFLHPIFWTLFFTGRKPTHVFKTRMVGADWQGDCGGVVCQQSAVCGPLFSMYN